MPKPDKPISVKYKANQSPQISYPGPDAGHVEVTEDSTITFSLANGSDACVLHSFTTNPVSADFSIISGVDTTTLVVDDDHADPGTYDYCISVRLPDGTTIVSDPQIINKT